MNVLGHVTYIISTTYDILSNNFQEIRKFNTTMLKYYKVFSNLELPRENLKLYARLNADSRGTQGTLLRPPETACIDLKIVNNIYHVR